MEMSAITSSQQSVYIFIKDITYQSVHNCGKLGAQGDKGQNI